jgi:hypothetical protein
VDAKTNEEFTQHLWATVRETEAAGYDPRRFKTMLNTDGGFDAVKRILESGKPSDGFTKLWEFKRLNLTCEAILVESKWRPCFGDDLLARSERVLRQSGYAFKPSAERSDAGRLSRQRQDHCRTKGGMSRLFNAPATNPMRSHG